MDAYLELFGLSSESLNWHSRTLLKRSYGTSIMEPWFRITALKQSLGAQTEVPRCNSWQFTENTMNWINPPDPKNVSCCIGRVEDWLQFGVNTRRESVSMQPFPLPQPPTLAGLLLSLDRKGRGKAEGKGGLFWDSQSCWSGVGKLEPPPSEVRDSNPFPSTPNLVGSRKSLSGPPSPPIQRQQLRPDCAAARAEKFIKEHLHLNPCTRGLCNWSAL